MPTPFLFLDTNAYLYSVFNTQEKHDSELLKRLAKLLEEQKAKLLLPEVVELEYLRKQQELLGGVINEVRKLKDQIDKIAFPEYLARHKQGILTSVDQEVRTRESNKQAAEKVLPGIFTSTNVVRLPLDNDVMLRAYKRALRGKKPFKPVVSDELSGNQLWNQDCVIAEGVISYFEHNPYGTERLLFCSANIRDFASWDKDAEAHVLDEDIRNDLRCNVTYFRYLPDLLASEFQVTVPDEGRLQHVIAEKAINQTNKSAILAQFAGALSAAMDPDELARLTKNLMAHSTQEELAHLSDEDSTRILLNLRWPQVVEKVKERNPLLSSVLASARPVTLDDDTVYVVFATEFNRKSATKAANVQLIEGIILPVLGAHHMKALTQADLEAEKTAHLRADWSNADLPLEDKP